MAQFRLHDLEGEPQVGNFALSQDKTVPGLLTLRGSDSTIMLWFPDPDRKDPDIPNVIKGILSNGRKVSLIGFHQTIDFQRQGVHTESGNPAGCMLAITVFPRYVAVGDFYLKPGVKDFQGVGFSTDESHLLFSYSEAFGSLSFSNEAEQIVNRILELENREAKAGKYPIVVYSTGDNLIFEANTELGHVEAFHATTISLTRDRADQLSNEIFMRLDFDALVDIQCALSRTNNIIHFLELLIGRPQNFTELTLFNGTDRDRPEQIQFYDSLYPQYHRPEPSESRLQPLMTPQEMSQVLTNWAGRTKPWGKARSRFYDCFVKQCDYDADRLVTAVNMFDALPKEAIPERKALGVNLEAATLETKRLFTDLPDSSEKHQMLSLIGRLRRGSVAVKQKIQHRARIVGDQLEGRTKFKDLTTENLCAITGAAVDCRNFFVHGSGGEPKYWQQKDIVQFFTETLEFVFTISDFVEAGWDPYSWINSPCTGGHHFLDEYLLFYQAKFETFRAFREIGQKPS